MRILVAGGTGVVGRRAVGLLRPAGHDVEAVGSSFDLFDRDGVHRAVAGRDAVVNLATAIPSGARMALRSSWELTGRLRTEGARNLADAAAATGARYVQESVVTVYDDGGPRWLDESAPVRDEAMLGPALAGEAHAERVGGVALRFGLFYGPDAAHTRQEVAVARRGFATTLGPAEAYWPDLHLDDAGRAVVAALDAPAGTYNVVGDEPLRLDERAAVVARSVGRGDLHRPPAFLGSSGLARILARSRRVSNRRFREATGWAPAFPSVREGYPSVAAEVLAGG